MSGYRLRNLLEDAEFCSTLCTCGGNNNNSSMMMVDNMGTNCPVHNHSSQNQLEINNKDRNTSLLQQQHLSAQPLLLHNNNNKTKKANLEFGYGIHLNTASAPSYGEDSITSKYSAEKKSALTGFDSSGAVVNAALLDNVWDSSDKGEDNFNLEYMDLDEFLSETGLLDANFTDLMNSTSKPTTPVPPGAPSQPSNSSPPQQQLRSPVTDRPSALEQLLLSTSPAGSHIPPSPSSSARSCNLSSSSENVVFVKEVTQQTLSPTRSLKMSSSSGSGSESETESETSGSMDSAAPTSVKLTASQVVKKRRYKEDGEGLQETSVVVVPGQEGFNPAAVKFNADELQPQPIVRKSKKQLVPEESKDEKYWKRRNKNNVAAKRSREARRAKENQIIMRAGFLESENERLSGENKELLVENEKLKNMIKRYQEGEL